MQKPGLFGMNGVLVFLLSFLSVAVHAQQAGNLILIDAENKQAFTVRIGDQLFSSSGHGHLVLSHLRDSSYRLNLRFPKKNLSEQIFPVTVHQKDLGFQLKGSDTSWVLYNWQTRETIRPVFEKDSNRILDQGVKREDGFSKLMAAVVNDTSVMYNTYSGNGFHSDSAVAKGQRPAVNGQLPITNPPSIGGVSQSSQPPLTAPPVVVVKQDKKISNDSLAASRKAAKDSLLAVRKAVKDSLLAAKKAARDSLLTVKRANASRDSLLLVQKAVRKDSPVAVSKTLPASNVQLRTNKDSIIATNGQPSTSIPGIKKLREISLKISRKLVFIDLGKDGIPDTITLFVYFEPVDTAVKKAAGPELMAVKKPLKQDSAALIAGQVKNKPGQALKSPDQGCAQLATEVDLETLRSAILKANTEQDKISAASGVFAIKCFSVAQVRVLAGLFVLDKARYHLMDAARLHISDHDHFRELADMYTDKNFQKKFLVMAEKRS